MFSRDLEFILDNQSRAARVARDGDPSGGETRGNEVRNYARSSGGAPIVDRRFGPRAPNGWRDPTISPTVPLRESEKRGRKKLLNVDT